MREAARECEAETERERDGEGDGEGTLREGDGEVLRDSDGDRVGVLVALAAREVVRELVSDDETLQLADCGDAQARNSIKTRVRRTAAAARMLPEA